MSAKRLENIAETAARKSRHEGRLEARAALRDFTTVKRVRSCGFAAGQEVRARALVESSGTTAGVAGLKTCGSVWVCPCCASKISRTRTDDVDQAIRTWADQGNSFVMLTLTMQHKRTDRLSALWDGLSGSWRKFVSDKTYKTTTKGLGVRGYHRVTEVTVGANGWHVHLHVLYFVQGRPGDLTSRAAGGALVGRWINAVDSQGFSATAAAQDWKILRGSAQAISQVAGYFHKGEYRERARANRDPRLVALEMTRADLKRGRNGGRTPFQVLEEIVNGLHTDGVISESDLALWSEWEEASHGRRQSIWSRGLRDLVGLDQEISDEEAAAAEVDGVDLVIIPADEWRKIARDGRAHLDFLAVIEEAGPSFFSMRQAASDWLTSRGVRHTLCAHPSSGVPGA